MSTNIYGIDLLINQDNQFRLCEINGQNSGMRGFAKLYGDDRVAQRVIQTLEEHAGKITINNGLYTAMRYVAKHPFKAFWLRQIGRTIPFLPPLIMKVQRKLHQRRIQREYAHNGYMEWLTTQIPSNGENALALDDYIGQDSTVLNYTREYLPHPTVNSYEADTIADNKLLQYVLLRESPIKEYLIPTIAAAMGAEDPLEIDSFTKNDGQFIMKPTLGRCGLGVRVLNAQELTARKNLAGFYRKPGWRDLALADHREFNPASVAEAINVLNYRFELGLAVIQPFINTERDGLNRSIRAIVCCNKFIDAYERVSSSPVVNLSQGADVREAPYGDLPSLCEQLIHTYEERIKPLEGKNVKDILYKRWLESRPSSQYSSEIAALLPYLNIFENLGRK